MWETMYEEFWEKLEHFCAKLCRDESRAEDLTQEVFLRALQNRELIDGFNARQCKAVCHRAEPLLRPDPPQGEGRRTAGFPAARRGGGNG